LSKEDDIKRIEVINPKLVYKPNCAYMNAQCIHEYDELKVELWCDKHYHNHLEYGDKDGAREGIEIDGVQEAIIESFKYLLDIYLRGTRFDFINYFDPKKPKKPPHRIVVKKILEESVLNVVMETHYLESSKFEITVITAMVVDDFKVADGQHVITISDNKATLRRSIRKELIKIYQLEF